MKYLFLIFLFLSINLKAQVLTGFVREEGSKEQLPGANIYCLETKKGNISNKFGFYSIEIPSQKDSVTIVFSMMGYGSNSFRILPGDVTKLDVILSPKASDLDEVVVVAQEEKISQTARMSVQNIPIQQVQDIPALLGEKDILKVLQLLPGIQRGNDGSGLFFVRGGASDQNLLLLDDAPVYNMFHAGGFFSVFNGNALKSFEIMKGAFPSRYGGRLSSVIEVQTKDGNKERVAGNLTLGMLSSSAVLEGPIKKGKASFLLSGRMSYWDKLYAIVRPSTNNNRVLFGLYDYSAKIHWEITPKDKLYISTYAGRDSFDWTKNKGKQSNISDAPLGTSIDFGLNWGNQTATVRWNRVFSNKLFANTSLIYSHYNFLYSNDIIEVNPVTDENEKEETDFQARIQDLGLKTDFDYFLNDEHHLRFGGGYTKHSFTPEQIQIFSSANNFRRDTSVTVSAEEFHLYFEDEFRPTSRLTFNAGLRLSSFQVESKAYQNLEPRLNFAYLFVNDFALKGGYARMNQFVHLASNSGVGFPFDIWIPSSAQIAPQQSDQFSLGLAKDIFSKNIEISVEGFYKQMRNLIGMQEGSAFLSGNTLDIFKASLGWGQTWEDKIVQGTGLSYGLELFVQKKKGKLTGWTSYTWSKVTNQFAELNNGRSFYPRYDRRHNLSIVGIYQHSSKVTLSGTWTLASGQRLTVPTSKFEAYDFSIWNGLSNTNTNTVYEYSEYGNFKAPDYHRLDLNVQFHKTKSNNKIRTWEIGVFNVYNRLNPFFFTFSESNPTEFQKVSLFPIIPSVSYNLKF